MGISYKNFGPSAQMSGMKVLPPQAIAKYYPSVPAQAGDTHWSNVSLLMDMETLSDQSSNNHSISLQNSASLVSSEAKFGTQSADVRTVGDQVVIDTAVDGSSLDLRTGDWTVEYWVKPTAGSYNVSMVGVWNEVGVPNVSWMIGSTISGNLRWLYYSNDFYDNDLGLALTQNTWQHLAVCKEGTNVRVYHNGLLISSTNIVGTIASGTNQKLKFGSNIGNTNVYLDEVRITKGVARYTENFTPPTEAFPTS